MTRRADRSDAERSGLQWSGTWCVVVRPRGLERIVRQGRGEERRKIGEEEGSETRPKGYRRDDGVYIDDDCKAWSYVCLHVRVG